MSDVTYLVFSQNGPPQALDVASRGGQFLAVAPIVEELAGVLSVNDCFLSWREATQDDWRAAAMAEERGRAAGMALLARRCQTVWELEAGAATSREFWQLCAGLASIALGPILPPDGATLYGIRSSLAQADLAKAGLARIDLAKVDKT